MLGCFSALQRHHVRHDLGRSANDVLLAPFYGLDGDTTYTDLLGKTVTIGAGVSSYLSKNRSRWADGITSLYIATAGGYGEVASSTDWNFGINPFQIRMCLRLDSSATADEILSRRNDTNDSANFWLIRKNATTNAIRVFARTSNVTVTDIVTTASFPTGDIAFHDLEVRRDSSGLVSIWFDGIQQALTTTTNSTTGSWPAPTASQALVIGNGDQTHTNGAIGYYNWIRIKKGSAPTSEYFITPPATARLPLSLPRY